MPIDPSVQAASLLATAQEISPIEHQNRFGARHRSIPDLAPGKVITILAVQTPVEFTADQFFAILEWLRDSYAVESMQTAFVAEVPDHGNDYHNDLHLSAHLRVEANGPAQT